MSTKAIFNRIPGLQLVSNKKSLGIIFSKIHKYYGEEFSFTPLTFTLPGDLQELESYMDKHSKSGKTFIAKPPGGAEGLGIFLLKK